MVGVGRRRALVLGWVAVAHQQGRRASLGWLQDRIGIAMPLLRAEADALVAEGVLYYEYPGTGRAFGAYSLGPDALEKWLERGGSEGARRWTSNRRSA